MLVWRTRGNYRLRENNALNIAFISNLPRSSFAPSKLLILHRSLLHGLHRLLQLPNPSPNPPTNLLPDLSISFCRRFRKRLFQLHEFFFRGGAVVGGVDGFLGGFVGCDFELMGGGRSGIERELVKGCGRGFVAKRNGVMVVPHLLR